MNDLVVVRQLPIIEEKLRVVATEIDTKLSIVDGLVCTEDSLKEIKKVRSEFNKDFALFEEERKAIKSAVTDPYLQFEAVYKECVGDKFKNADVTLKNKIGVVETGIRDTKMRKVRTYFDEYAESEGVAEYANFLKQMNDLRTSYTLNEFKRIAKERIDPIVSGLKAIEAQPDELRAEIMVEFKKSLDASEAISIVAERKKAIEDAVKIKEERESRQAVEAEVVQKVESTIPEPLAPPTVTAPLPLPTVVDDNDPVVKVTFTVTGNISKLRELKQFLINGGYKYE
jgi:hypothetical protein